MVGRENGAATGGGTSVHAFTGRSAGKNSSVLHALFSIAVFSAFLMGLNCAISSVVNHLVCFFHHFSIPFLCHFSKHCSFPACQKLHFFEGFFFCFALCVPFLLYLFKFPSGFFFFFAFFPPLLALSLSLFLCVCLLFPTSTIVCCLPHCRVRRTRDTDTVSFQSRTADTEASPFVPSRLQPLRTASPPPFRPR